MPILEHALEDHTNFRMTNYSPFNEANVNIGCVNIPYASTATNSAICRISPYLFRWSLSSD